MSKVKQIEVTDSNSLINRISTAIKSGIGKAASMLPTTSYVNSLQLSIYFKLNVKSGTIFKMFGAANFHIGIDIDLEYVKGKIQTVDVSTLDAVQQKKYSDVKTDIDQGNGGIFDIITLILYSLPPGTSIKFKLSAAGGLRTDEEGFSAIVGFEIGAGIMIQGEIIR